MRPVKQTQLSETETVGLETHTVVPHPWMPIWGLLSGDTIVFHFRALILYVCYCMRQTAKGYSSPACHRADDQKEKGNTGTKTEKLGYFLK